VLNAPVAVAGVFIVGTAPARNGGPIGGTVLVKETVSANGAVVVVNQIVSGIYEIDTDCTGGNIMLGNGNQVGLSLHIDGILTNTGFSDFHFYFSGPDRGRLELVSADNRGTTLSGYATMVGPIH
jgi:hypothetical protein